ncbi:MAG: ATP-binding protein, partial [Lachnospiraceae bacterium]|nr:ATP-binding protein [Lachnospiraceae bacterium]
AKPESSLVIVYGRRRVGKTTLLSEFIKHKESIYFLATQESEVMNRNAFKELVADFTQNELLSEAKIDKWDILFKAITTYNTDSKPVIIIDEFQYLGKSNPAFPSIFQKIWDEILKDNNIMVVLCGSLISMMVSQTLSYNSPLYGRRTAQIRLKQIPFQYYHEFYKNLSLKDQIERYAVTGGIPKYIESFPDNADIYAGIEDNILDLSGYLYEEPHFLLQQEVSEIGSYFSILRTIAFGNSKLADIAAALEVKSTDLTRLLKTLIDMDLIEREIPVTEKNPEKSKKGLYRIKDNYIRFWFTFIYPNQGEIERGNTEYVMQKIQKSFVRSHVAFIYEDICKDMLLQNKNIPYHFSKIGRYWDKNTEIDIVALNEEEQVILFGECKYWSNQINIDIFYQLQEKSQKVSWLRDTRKEIFVLFSISGYTQKLQELAANRDDLFLS